MPKGGSIINTSSINAAMPNPTLLPYAATKAAIANFTGGLAQLLIEKGIRVNAVGAGPVWTPLIPSTFEAEHIPEFGADTIERRPAHPDEIAPSYIFVGFCLNGEPGPDRSKDPQLPAKGWPHDHAAARR